MIENGVMIQYFEWYLPADQQHWNRLRQDAAYLAEHGITAVWIPPPYKGTGKDDVGYGVYDLWDLGEFPQKGTVATKYGTRAELQAAIDALHQHSVNVYLDVVQNHKAAADETERFLAREMDPNNRNQPISDFYEIEGWTKFTFSGRQSQYSSFIWNHQHFNGIDYDASRNKSAVFQIKGETWDQDVSRENGNYDYLMFANIDYTHPDVVNETKAWAKWVLETFQFDGFRLDAVKHISETFVKDFLESVRQLPGHEKLFAVGEYWRDDLAILQEYLTNLGFEISIFDVGLHYNLHDASVQGKNYDMSSLVNGTLLVHDPIQAVSFVENHDTQRGQALESTVQDWFKPQAYALILLAKSGYPCIFYGDLYGTHGQPSPHRWIIERLLKIRQSHAFCEQHTYFDHPHTVGLTRVGQIDDPQTGCALLLSNGEDGFKWMDVGQHHAGQLWYEATGTGLSPVTINDEGWGKFTVKAGHLAVWTPQAYD